MGLDCPIFIRGTHSMSVRPLNDIMIGTSFDLEIVHNPIKDITGSTFKLVLSKQETGTPDLVIEHVVGSNPSDVPLEGKAYITVTKENTSSLTTGEYYTSLVHTIGDNCTLMFRTGMKNIGKVKVFVNLGGI